MTAWYNENDAKTAAWLRELIKQDHIANGVVDERDIRDVIPDEIKGFTQHHFFAGIGVWSYALRQAGWSDQDAVWTGSCPCQSFSTAGRRQGFVDERHLWPHWFHLIQHAKPRGAPVFGEQVASKGALAWLDLVHADMEAEGHSVRAFDLCAAGFGSPNIRQRLFWVADTHGTRIQGWERVSERSFERAVGASGVDERLANTDSNRRGEGWGCNTAQERDGVNGDDSISEEHLCTRPTNGFWKNSDWLGCRDGKFRPVEPGTFPLVDGAAERVGLLRGYGNAINAEVAKAFIESYLEVTR